MRSWLGAGLLVLAAAAVVSRAAASGTALIEGTVTLPAADLLPPPGSRYPASGTYEAGPPDPPTAVVYLEGRFSAVATGAPPPVAEMAQQRYQFRPGVLAIRVGSPVRFPNRDDEYHSVFSYSKAKRFDLGRYHKDEPQAELVFDQAGVVKLFCEIHEHMRGTIVVVDTPHFQRTDAAGRYRLAGLPAGRFVLKAWVADRVYERPVDLAEGATLRVDFPGE